MNDVIETYLNDLDRLLGERVSEPRRSELVAEVRAHLSLAVKDLGLGAEQEAIARLGPVKLLAQELIRQETGLSTKPAWKLARLPLLLLIVALAIELGVLFQEPTLGMMQLTTWSQWLSLVSLAGFGIMVLKSRRWLVRPFIAVFLCTSVVAAVLLTGFWTGAIGSPRRIGGMSSRSASISGQAATLASLKRDLEYAANAESAIQSGRPLPKKGANFLRPSVYEIRSSEIVWGVGIPGSGQFRASLIPTADSKFASSEWRAEGARVISYLKSDAASAEQFSRELPNITVWGYFCMSLVHVLLSSLLHVAVLVALNGLLLLVSNAGLRRVRAVRTTVGG